MESCILGTLRRSASGPPCNRLRHDSALCGIWKAMLLETVAQHRQDVKTKGRQQCGKNLHFYDDVMARLANLAIVEGACLQVLYETHRVCSLMCDCHFVSTFL